LRKTTEKRPLLRRKQPLARTTKTIRHSRIDKTAVSRTAPTIGSQSATGVVIRATASIWAEWTKTRPVATIGKWGVTGECIVTGRGVETAIWIGIDIASEEIETGTGETAEDITMKTGLDVG
jgi:hypothetical protein